MTSYYSVIPSRVLTDRRLNANAKLVYGIIAATACEAGYSTIGNAECAETLGVALRSIPRMLAGLEERNLICVELLPTENDNEERRRIWLHDAFGSYLSASDGQTRNVEAVVPEGGHDTSVMGVMTPASWGHDTSVMGVMTPASSPPQKNAAPAAAENACKEYIYNTSSNTRGNSNKRESPHQLAGQTKNAQKAHSPSPAADDGFDRFWRTYPRKVDKQRALAEWRKLAPGPELTETILQALEKQCTSSQWQDVEYIPHPRTWLHNRRWEAVETQPGRGQRVTPTGLDQW